jgi:hypothetical protein
MNFEDMQFPVYRKYKNNKSYFKIINPALFEQVQVVGSKRFVTEVKAELYPEKLFISDLLTQPGIAEEISESEYLEAKKEP